jgi:hypothetical protein
MERWSVEHRALDVKTVFKNNDSVVVTQRIFRRHFNIHRSYSVIRRNTVLLCVRNFIETSSVAKRKPPKEYLHLELLMISNECARNLSQILADQQAEMLRRILHENLNFYPYKLVMSQARNDQCTVNLFVRFCWTLDNDDVNHVLMTNEANFYLCCNVSFQNCRYWATQNPRDTHQKPLHSNKVVIWWGVASFGVMGP